MEKKSELLSKNGLYARNNKGCGADGTGCCFYEPPKSRNSCSIVSSRILEDDKITIYGTSAGLIRSIDFTVLYQAKSPCATNAKAS